MTSRPSFQFYPGDWLTDTKLRLCSIAARGLWIELICWMHDLEPYGVLANNGEPISDDQAATMCGLKLPIYRQLLGELLSAKVAHRDEAGAIYSARMVRDEDIRRQRVIAGTIAQQLRQQVVKQVDQQFTEQLVEDEDEEEDEDNTQTKGILKGDVESFTQAWAIYPKRPNNSKQRAYRAWQARIAEGVRPQVMLEGVKRYAAYCRRERTEPRFVKMTSTFFGPDHHWESDYSSVEAPKPQAQTPAYHRKYVPRDMQLHAIGDTDERVIALGKGIGVMPSNIASNTVST